jgi:hypothetical protein
MKDIAMPTDMPEKMWVKEQGNTTRRKYSPFVNPSTRALSRIRWGTEAAPAKEFTKTGQKAPMKTTAIAALRNPGNRAMAYGT